VEASTRERAHSLDMLTIIVPHPISQQVTWTAHRLEDSTTFGARLQFPTRQLTLRFPRHNSSNKVLRVESRLDKSGKPSPAY
jgi:hypothetical protein